MLVLKQFQSHKIFGQERKVIFGNLALKGLNNPLKKNPSGMGREPWEKMTNSLESPEEQEKLVDHVTRKGKHFSTALRYCLELLPF